MKYITRIPLLFSVCVGMLLNTNPVAGNTDLLDIASYTITAEYTPDTHTISAQETAIYRNTTTDPIPYIVLHLYLNAFRHPETLWMRESGTGFRGIQYDELNPGWINIDSIHLTDGPLLQPDAVDADQTLVRILLPEPIPPGDEVSLDIVFTAALPRVFARTGWADDGDFVLAGQWFPKFGVWQQGTWNAYPFHANSEFFADFGTYQVNLTLPENWVVGTSAVPEGTAKINADGTVTHTFFANRIIDFVWTASPHFHQITRQHGDIDIRVLFYPSQRAVARRSMDAALQGLDLFNQWIGPYANGNYSHLTVVIVPPDAGGAGGMEYPTLFTVGALGSNSPRCLKLTEVETIHELAHQWFQSVIATNEAEEPWLDEGFADYSTSKAIDVLYDGGFSSCGNWRFSYLAMQRASYIIFPELTMSGAAWDFGMEYSIATYAKPVVSLTTLEHMVGEDKMLAFLQAYFNDFAFSHPTAQNVQQTMSNTLGQKTADWFFNQLVDGTRTMDAFVAEFESDHITLERQGDLCVPTSVRLFSQSSILRKSATEDVLWSCDTSTLRIDGAYAAVEIDPQQEILIDLNMANNGARRNPVIKEWLGLTVRMLKDIQNLYWSGVLW